MDAVSGYSGGTLDHPTYEDVCTGQTGHAEVVEVLFDPARLPLDDLLDAFWAMHDPTSAAKGQYRSVIFTTTPEQQAAAEASKSRLAARTKRPVSTRIAPAGTFWPAEEYHQRFYEKKGLHRSR